MINGKTIFPPVAVPISPSGPPPEYPTHWYAGSVFSGTSQTGSWVFTEITTPTSNPKTDEFYYVIASIWDNAGSYDQVGFADDYGVWGLAYSWTSGPCSSPTYNFSPDAMNLALGTTYDFYIYVSGGYTYFEAYVGSTLVWYLNPAAPTATSLSIANSYCGYYDYTDYIEVDQTDVSGGYPLFIFTFSQNQWYNGNSWLATSWTAFTAGPVPAAVSVVISGQTVYVEQNQTLTTNVASGSGSVSPNCPSGCPEEAGSSISVTATPSANWRFSSWTINGASCSGGSSSNPCTFTMPDNGVTVSATFTTRVNSVSLIAPANNTALTATYPTLSVRVVTTPATVEKDVQVIVKVNNTQVCPIGNATSAGAFSCAYSVEGSGLYQWNATVEGEVASSNMTGTLTSGTFTFTAGPYVQTIALVPGWNLISLPIVPASTAIGTVLASQIADASFTVVSSYQGGAWKSATLNPTTHRLLGPLTTMQDGAGYWIFMNKADNLFVVGNVFAPPPATPPSYSLSAGWNLVGFKPQPTIAQEKVGTYLTSITGDYNTNNVWIYDSGAWIRADSNYMLQPGEAMWILMTTAAILTP